MKPINAKVTALALLLAGGTIAVGILHRLTIIYQPLYQPTGEMGYNIYDLMMLLVTIVLQITLLGYVYIQFRKVLPSEKAQWLAVAISTVALTLSTVTNELIMELVTYSGPREHILSMVLYPAALLGGIIWNFLISLGVVHLIAQFYKRRSSFEVE